MSSAFSDSFERNLAEARLVHVLLQLFVALDHAGAAKCAPIDREPRQADLIAVTRKRIHEGVTGDVVRLRDGAEHRGDR